MKFVHDTIARVRAFAELTGTTPDRVCRNATGNPRLWERLLRRVDQLETDCERIVSYMDTAQNRAACHRVGGEDPEIQEAAE
jgi:Holliday junction resolvasome RuvABC ATP-dependent DNA helicase subunit